MRDPLLDRPNRFRATGLRNVVPPRSSDSARHRRLVPVAASISKDFETEEVGRNRHLGYTLYCARVTESTRTAHVAQEGLHRFHRTLHRDEDRAVGAVRHRADHAVAPGRLGHAHPVVHSLNPPGRDTVPMHDRAHGASKPWEPKSFPA